MIEIRNLLSQPLAFQLAGRQSGLHLGCRERKTVRDAQVSEEIRIAAKRGLIDLRVLEQADQPEGPPMISDDSLSPPEAAAQPNGEMVTGEEPDQLATTLVNDSDAADPDTKVETRTKKRR